MLKKIFSFLLLCFILVNTKAQEIKIDREIQLKLIQDSIFVHTSLHYIAGYDSFPSNGLVVIKKGEAILIDTPMDNEKTERLINFIEDSLNSKVIKHIPGHYHSDCTGGMKYLQRRNIKTLANHLTAEQCKKDSIPLPNSTFKDSILIDFNGLELKCKYFGGGHTKDNMIIWFPSQQILFGGCLIKSIHATGLGYTGDAVISEWDVTIKKIVNELKDIKTVVPGHGSIGDQSLLQHTIQLVEKHRIK